MESTHDVPFIATTKDSFIYGWHPNRYWVSLSLSLRMYTYTLPLSISPSIYLPLSLEEE